VWKPDRQIKDNEEIRRSLASSKRRCRIFSHALIFLRRVATYLKLASVQCIILSRVSIGATCLKGFLPTELNEMKAEESTEKSRRSLWKMVTVKTSHCENRSLWKMVSAKTSHCEKCSKKTGHCENLSLWKPVFVKTGFCENWSLWKLVTVKTGHCENRSLWKPL
jgi:hypothetical protein